MCSQGSLYSVFRNMAPHSKKLYFSQGLSGIQECEFHRCHEGKTIILSNPEPEIWQGFTSTSSLSQDRNSDLGHRPILLMRAVPKSRSDPFSLLLLTFCLVTCCFVCLSHSLRGSRCEGQSLLFPVHSFLTQCINLMTKT